MMNRENKMTNKPLMTSSQSRLIVSKGCVAQALSAFQKSKLLIFALIFILLLSGCDPYNKRGALSLRFEHLSSDYLADETEGISWRPPTNINNELLIEYDRPRQVVVLTDIKSNQSFEIRMDYNSKGLRVFQEEDCKLIFIDKWDGNSYSYMTNSHLSSYIIQYVDGSEPVTYKFKKGKHPICYKNGNVYFYQNDAIYVAKLNEIEQAKKVADIDASMKNDYVIINFICSDEQIEVHYEGPRASREWTEELIIEVHVATVELGEA